jgi:hypothetical protein
VRLHYRKEQTHEGQHDFSSKVNLLHERPEAIILYRIRLDVARDCILGKLENKPLLINKHQNARRLAT